MSKEAPLIEQSYRFVLDVRPEQEAVLVQCLGASRFWFNQGLAQVKTRLDQRAAGNTDVDLPWSYKGLCSVLDAQWRNEVAPWQKDLPCGTYMAAFDALGAGLQNFTNARKTGRKVGFPDWRRKGKCTESVFFQKVEVLDVRHIKLHPSLGPLRCKERLTKLQRLLAGDEHARMLRATISRQGHQWVIAIGVKRSPKQRRARRPNAAVGVDVGLSRQATLSTGQVFANIRPLQQALKRLARLQRQLDRQRRANNPGNYHANGTCKKGSRNWTKSRRQLETERLIARLHARVANIRREQAHLLTTFLVREYGVIGAETLNVKEMLANRRLARHISDVGWALIIAQLKYKVAWSEDSILTLADRFYPSSKECSACHSVKATLDLSERIFACEACGHVADRDVNAGVNLGQLALADAHAQGRTDVVLARPVATRATRGATDLEVTERRSEAEKATAMNRSSPDNGLSRVVKTLALAA